MRRNRSPEGAGDKSPAGPRPAADPLPSRSYPKAGMHAGPEPGPLHSRACPQLTFIVIFRYK